MSIEEADTLAKEEMQMRNDLSALQLRWGILREEKLRVANTLSNIKRVEEELDRLSEEKSQVELDLKVTGFC